MANITIDTSAELNLDMEAMTSTTKAKYDVFNDKYKQILENDNALNTSIQETAENINTKINGLSSSLNKSMGELQASLEGKITKMNRVTTVTFSIDNWIGTTAPYTNTVTLANATGEDEEKPEIYMNVPSAVTTDSAEAYVEAFGYITKYETGVGTITATAMYEKPSANIVVDVKGI